MTPPHMAGWNLALRFGLELAALIGLGAAAWNLSDGPMRYVGAIGLPLVAATLWGVFNVLNDPSRSGEAPVEVAGWIRLAIELLVLGAGAVALGAGFGQGVAIGFIAITLMHYVVSWSRVQWLLGV